MNSSPGNSSERRRMAAKELVQGREFAWQLGRVLQNSPADDSSSSTAQELVMKILDSFSKSISILNRSDSDELLNGIRLDAADNYSPSSWKCTEDRRICSKDSKMKKNRRGFYKRKKSSHSWMIESSSLIDDGYTWRKYGQKVILKAKYHRNYFRCSHKYDEGCLATKQVQRIEEDPPKFCTTYNGDHTCRNRSSNLHETSTDLAGDCLFSVSEDLVPPDHSTAFHGEFRLQMIDECIDMTSGGDDRSQSKYADEVSEVMVESYVNFDDDDAVTFTF